MNASLSRGFSILTQMTLLVVASVLIANALTFAIVASSFAYSSERADDPRVWETKVGVVAGMVLAAEPALRAAVVESAVATGVAVRLVDTATLRSVPAPDARIPDVVRQRLAAIWNVPLAPELAVGDEDPAIVVPVSAQLALVFGVAPARFVPPLSLGPALPVISGITVALVLLSAYAVRVIVRPLSVLGEAVHSFMSLPSSDREVQERGPREIRDLSLAFNRMRKSIRRLVRDRTQMLLAMSHDLRTPLTRLRLRVERGSDPAKVHLLRDIAWIDQIVDDTLTYLHDALRAARRSPTDLPSMLLTICDQFADMGHAVQYQGPARFSYECKNVALNRAVANLVDNAVRHGEHVTVALAVDVPGFVEISVIDDGPGIPPRQREDLFDGVDLPRLARPGFGFGLSIVRDVASNHGGAVRLADAAPHGLAVTISLPAEVKPADFPYGPEFRPS